jgi:hypothetical protein
MSCVLSISALFNSHQDSPYNEVTFVHQTCIYGPARILAAGSQFSVMRNAIEAEGRYDSVSGGFTRLSFTYTV